MVAFSACGGGGNFTIGAGTPLPDTRCDDGLCVSDDAAVMLVDARTALETCVPDDEQGFESDPSGLRIADVELSEERGVTFVDVLLANTGSQSVYDAPGTELVVVDGEAEVATERGLNPDDSARTQVYAVAACEAESHRYIVELGDGPVTLQVSALWDEDRPVETIELVIVPPRAPR
jgi:hypothetical protein